jgi:hypothetical protein
MSPGYIRLTALAIHSSPFENFLSPGPVESRPVPGVEWAEGGSGGGRRRPEVARCGLWEDVWGAKGSCLDSGGPWRAAKSRPSDSGGFVIPPTWRRAQDRQSTQRVLFGRRRESMTWPVLGRNYRERSAGNGWTGASGRR